jgi:hypothetical protein
LVIAGGSAVIEGFFRSQPLGFTPQVRRELRQNDESFQQNKKCMNSAEPSFSGEFDV